VKEVLRTTKEIPDQTLIYKKIIEDAQTIRNLAHKVTKATQTKCTKSNI